MVVMAAVSMRRAGAASAHATGCRAGLLRTPTATNGLRAAAQPAPVLPARRKRLGGAPTERRTIAANALGLA